MGISSRLVRRISGVIVVLSGIWVLMALLADSVLWAVCGVWILLANVVALLCEINENVQKDRPDD